MRFSLSLVAFVYLGFVAAAVLPTVPSYIPGVSARELPVGNVGSPSVPLPSSTPHKAIVGASAPALPDKVPRGDSNIFEDILNAAGKGEKGGKRGAIAMARREESTTMNVDKVHVST